MGPWERILCPSIIIKHFFTSLGLSERPFHPWIVSLLLVCYIKGWQPCPHWTFPAGYIFISHLWILCGVTPWQSLLPGIKERLIWCHVTALSHHPATPWRGRPLNLHLNCSNLRRTHPTCDMTTLVLVTSLKDEHIQAHHHHHNLNYSNLRRAHPTHPMPRPYLRVLPSYFLTYQDEHILGHHHIHIVYPTVFR